MTKPQQLMEQMAESYIGLHPEDAYLAAQQGYRDGWQARDKVLLESAVEFDEPLALLVSKDQGYISNPLSRREAFQDGARWQHNLLTLHYEARIAKLESEKAELLAKEDLEYYKLTPIEDLVAQSIAQDKALKEGGEDE